MNLSLLDIKKQLIIKFEILSHYSNYKNYENITSMFYQLTVFLF